MTRLTDQQATGMTKETDRPMSDEQTKQERVNLAADGEALARKFHETYERLAPSFGYETRTETRDFDPTTPNGRLMIAVCSAIATHPAAIDEPHDKPSLRRAEDRVIAGWRDAMGKVHEVGEEMAPRPISAAIDDDEVERLWRCYKPASTRLRNMTTINDMRHAFEAGLRAAHPDERVEVLVKALEKARAKFAHYVDLHRVKCTSEGDEKADRNQEMVDLIDTALASVSTKTGGA